MQFIMAALWNGAGHYIFALWFLLFPRLISAIADWMSAILPHKMQVWNVLHVARWKYRTQKIDIWAPSHNYIFAIMARIDNLNSC